MFRYFAATGIVIPPKEIINLFYEFSYIICSNRMIKTDILIVMDEGARGAPWPWIGLMCKRSWLYIIQSKIMI